MIKALRIVCWTGLLLLGGCGEGEVVQSPERISGSTPPTAARLDPRITEQLRAVALGYHQQINDDLARVEQSLQALAAEVDSFLATPDLATLNALRNAWLLAHSAWEAAALHRQFASLMLTEAQGLELNRYTFQVNNWPILPGYIDYVQGYPDSGIVNDITVPLDLAALRGQHGLFDLAEAAIGFHVVEFLIWGENLDRRSPRPAEDFVEITRLNAEQQAAGLTLPQLSSNRRRQLLALTITALREDFAASRAILDGAQTATTDRLASMEGTELLALLLGSITGLLSEELLVRSLYPMLNGNFSDSIQSPFSHSTQNAVSALLTSVEQLLLAPGSGEGDQSLDAILMGLSMDYRELFFQNFDASKECLVLLYTTLEAPADAATAFDAEFEIVECINLLTVMIDHLEQIVSSVN